MIDYTLPLDHLPDPLPIEPLTKPFDVTITPPGSKSITCRAYVLAALAEGESKIIRPLRADDTDHLLSALCTLGVEARWDGEDVYIKGVAGRFPRGGKLYMGEGGTPTRFMIACACLAKEPVLIDASPRMRERPIAEGVDMLRQLGAKIEYVEAERRLPVRVAPDDTIYRAEEINVRRTYSSQFVSAMLLIAPCLESGLYLRFVDHPTSGSYVYLTTWMLDEWDIRCNLGVSYDEFDNPIFHDGIRVYRGTLRARDYRIERDASSCAYWHEAAAIVPGSRAIVPMHPLLSNQPDRGVCFELANLGAEIDFHEDAQKVTWTAVLGPILLHPVKKELEGVEIPDGSVALAAACARTDSTVRITGLHTLRVKETDRIAALANELRRVGCTVETGEDWISITPNSLLHAAGSMDKPIIIETYNDHRMAMAFAVLGLNPPGGRPLAIRNPKCVAKSYPGFWKDFAKLYQ